MYIEELYNGKYRVGQWYKDPMNGKRHRVSIIIEKKTKKELRLAQLVLDEKVRQAVGQTESKNMTLEEFGTVYMENQRKINRQSTAVRNEYFVKDAYRILGEDTLIERLNAGYIKNKLLNCGKGVTWRNEFLVRFKSMMRWGYDNDYVENISYLTKLKPFKDDAKKERLSIKYLEQDELRTLIEGMDVYKWKQLTQFLALTGLRIGEALALEISDIDLKKREIRVSKTFDPNNKIVNNQTKTAAGTRVVSIQDELFPLARELKRSAQTEAFLSGMKALFQEDGKVYGYDAYRKYLKENSLRLIGKTVTPHWLRHTHVSLLACSMTLEEVSRRVGHSDSGVTKQIYFHVTEKLQEKEKEKMKQVRIL